MFDEKIEAKSLAITLVFVVAIALVTAFLAAWTQQLIMGKTYVAVTTVLAVMSAFVVFSVRHRKRVPSGNEESAR